MVLRSKTPDGATQEIWALLCAYHAIREMICAAAALAALDPLRICFASALDTVRGPVGDPAAFPRPHRPARPRLTGRHRLRHQPARPGRDNPRHAKRSHRYPAKAADPAMRKKPRGPFTLVMLPLPLAAGP